MTTTVVSFKGTHSLANFNPFSQSEPLLDSPRSLEACRRQGIDPKELIPKTMDECRKHLGSYTDDLVSIYFEASEERRKYKMHLVETERNRIIAQSSPNVGKMQSTLRNKSPMNDEKRLMALRRKQEIEVKLAAEKQRLREESEERNRAKAEIAAQREAIRQQQLAALREEREQKRIAEEAKKRKITAEMEMLEKVRKQQQFEKEKEKVKEIQLSEKMKKREIRIETAERERKKAEFEASIKAKLDFQAKRIAERRELMRKREEERKLLEAMQSAEKRAKSAEIQFEKSQKIKVAKDNLNALLKIKREEYDKKQQLAESKLRAFEESQKRERNLARKVCEQLAC